MAPLIEALSRAAAPALDVTDAPRALLAALDLDGDGDAEAGLERLRERDPRLAVFVEPMLGVTFAPTMISASEKINVLPAAARSCRSTAACRPATARRPRSGGSARSSARTATRSSSHEQVVGNGSPVESPLMDAIRGWVEREDPGARVVPTMLPGVHRLALVPGRVPGRAWPTASSPSGRRTCSRLRR